MIIPPCAYRLYRDIAYTVHSTPIHPMETISEPGETLVTHINQLGDFTHPTSEASWTTRGVWPIKIAIGIPDYSCPKLIRSRGE